jgi:hypothetical protein
MGGSLGAGFSHALAQGALVEIFKPRRIAFAAHPLHLFGRDAVGLQESRELVADAYAGRFLGRRTGLPIARRRGDGAVERLRLCVPFRHCLPVARLDCRNVTSAALVLVIEIAADPAAVLVAPDLAGLGVGLTVAVPLDHRRRGGNLFSVARWRVEHGDAVLLAIAPAHRLVLSLPVVEPVRGQPPARKLPDRIQHLAPPDPRLAQHQPRPETGNPPGSQRASGYGDWG